MPYDGLSQRAPRLVRARPPHGSDLVVNEASDTLFRRLYEFGWNGGNAVLDRSQPLWGTCRPPLRLAAPPCGSAAGSSIQSCIIFFVSFHLIENNITKQKRYFAPKARKNWGVFSSKILKSRTGSPRGVGGWVPTLSLL